MAPPKEDNHSAKKSHKPRKYFRRKYLPWITIVLLVMLSGFLLIQYREAQNKLNVGSPPYYASMTKNLGKLIILPKTEKPTILTVKNAAALKGQLFYANAKNGDLTFVYSKSQKAILYRPSDNIIVNVAPVNISSAK
jgi:hypothetical protein